MILNKQIQKNIRIMFGEDAQDRTQRVLKRLRDDKAKDEHIPGSLTLIGRCAVDHAAADIIEQLDTQVPRWISVEERLPKGNVLAVNDRGTMHIGSVEYYKNGGFKVCICEDCDSCISISNVTHWMPLPEPPEEG